MPETLAAHYVRHVYKSSDGAMTKQLYALLAKRGAAGEVAVELFRAQKCSERAKKYRGGIRGVGSFKAMAYERKGWALHNLCTTLLTGAAGSRIERAVELNISFGWKEDPRESFARWVLYVELPNGQVSFHSPVRHDGPDFKGEWDGQHLSCERVLAFCDAVLRNEITSNVFSVGALASPLSSPLPAAVPSPRRFSSAQQITLFGERSAGD